jgi:DNA repair protein RadC
MPKIPRSEKPPKDLNAEHRERLRARFLKSGVDSLHDYELVELLLTLGIHRKDCKPMAKQALERFKGLRGVLEAKPEDLQKIKGIGPVSSFTIAFVRELGAQYLKEKVRELPDLTSSSAVYGYLHMAMSALKTEVFKVLFLDSQNRLRESQDLFKGTINASAVFSREVVAAAIKHNATALIFVHNHPSGNPAPSQADRNITRELVMAAATVDIKVLDHIIIGGDRYFSFASEGLMAAYTADVNRLKGKS